MSFRLEKIKTGSTPYILVDEERSYMRFEGESFHENVIEFYRDVSAWLIKYLKTDFGHFTFDCELKYFNSSTAKLLLNILLEMDERCTEKNKVVVNWISSEGNDIIIECGEDFKDEMRNLDFNLVIK